MSGYAAGQTCDPTGNPFRYHTTSDSGFGPTRPARAESMDYRGSALAGGTWDASHTTVDAPGTNGSGGLMAGRANQSDPTAADVLVIFGITPAWSDA